MRVIILFVLLLVVLGVAYVLVPAEQMQLKAKNTIQQVQSLETSLDFEDVADEFGVLFEKQKERLTEAAGREDIVKDEFGMPLEKPPGKRCRVFGLLLPC